MKGWRRVSARHRRLGHRQMTILSISSMLSFPIQIQLTVSISWLRAIALSRRTSRGQSFRSPTPRSCVPSADDHFDTSRACSATRLPCTVEKKKWRKVDPRPERSISMISEIGWIIRSTPAVLNWWSVFKTISGSHSSCVPSYSFDVLWNIEIRLVNTSSHLEVIKLQNWMKSKCRTFSYSFLKFRTFRKERTNLDARPFKKQ